MLEHPAIRGYLGQLATLPPMAALREGKRAENLVSSATAPSLDPTKALSPSLLPSTLLAFLWKAQTAFVLPSIATKGKEAHFNAGQRWR